MGGEDEDSFGIRRKGCGRYLVCACLMIGVAIVLYNPWVHWDTLNGHLQSVIGYACKTVSVGSDMVNVSFDLFNICASNRHIYPTLNFTIESYPSN